MIGDPSDKTTTRGALTRKNVLKNLATFKAQIGKILDFKDKKIRSSSNSTAHGSRN